MGHNFYGVGNPGEFISPLQGLGGIKKMAGSSHRTATTTYPCCLPALGRFSRSWSCKTCRRKDKGMKAVVLLEFVILNILIAAF